MSHTIIPEVYQMPKVYQKLTAEDKFIEEINRKMKRFVNKEEKGE